MSTLPCRRVFLSAKFLSLFKPKAHSNHEIRGDEKRAFKPIHFRVREANLNSKHGKNQKYNLKVWKVYRHFFAGSPSHKHCEGHDKEGDLCARSNRN